MIDSTVTKTIRVLATAIAFAIVLSLLYQLRSVIIWLAIGLFMAVIINPAVSKLAHYMPGKRRGLAVASVILLGLVSFTILSIIFVPRLVHQGAELIENWPDITQNISDKVEHSNEAPYKFMREHGVLEYFQNHQEEIKDSLQSFFGASAQKALSILGSIGAIFTIAAMTVYMSVNAPKYIETFKKGIPKRHHSDIEMLGAKMYSAVTGYVNGNLLTSGIAGICAGIVAAIAGLPYPALLGLIVAFTDLIPMVGATIGAVVVVVIALFSSVNDAIIMAIFFIIYQQFENYALVPKVMGKTVEMSSFAVFVSALAGGILAGFIGALVAIPIGACLQILGQYALQKSFLNPNR